MKISAMIIGVSGTSLTDWEQDFIQNHQPLGVILFARNIENSEQVKSLVSEFKSLINHSHPLVFIDQEGGRVARLRQPHWPEFPPAITLGNKQAVYENYAAIGAMLYELGINADCAPVLDLRIDGMHDIIGDRALGTTPKQVTELGGEVCRALMDQKIYPVIKHIPGHGRAKVDSHEDLPVVNAPLDLLEQTDFEPFKHFSNQAFAMTAHIIYEALDTKNCATQSKIVIDYIRDKIGFKGLIMTDDLSMKALKGNYDERAQKSLDAGCDIILHCNGDPVEMLEFAHIIPDLQPAQIEILSQFF